MPGGLMSFVENISTRCEEEDSAESVDAFAHDGLAAEVWAVPYFGAWGGRGAGASVMSASQAS